MFKTAGLQVHSLAEGLVVKTTEHFSVSSLNSYQTNETYFVNFVNPILYITGLGKSRAIVKD